jgi:hypothetical protein
MDLSGVGIVCDKGYLELSRVTDGIAYDQYGEAIPRRFFRHALNILDIDWVRDKKVQSCDDDYNYPNW